MTLEVIPETGNRPMSIEVSKVTAPFWNNLAKGIFQTTICKRCERLTFPPKAICPDCHSTELGWKELSGRGYLYSFTTIHSAPPAFQSQLPLLVAIIDLVEGVRIVTRLISKTSTSTLDVPIELVITQYEDGCLFAARELASRNETKKTENTL